MRLPLQYKMEGKIQQNAVGSKHQLFYNTQIKLLSISQNIDQQIDHSNFISDSKIQSYKRIVADLYGSSCHFQCLLSQRLPPNNQQISDLFQIITKNYHAIIERLLTGVQNLHLEIEKTKITAHNLYKPQQHIQSKIQAYSKKKISLQIEGKPQKNILGGIHLYNESYERGMNYFEREKKEKHVRKDLTELQKLKKSIREQIQHQTDVETYASKDQVTNYIIQCQNKHSMFNYISYSKELNDVKDFFNDCHQQALQFLIEYQNYEDKRNFKNQCINCSQNNDILDRYRDFQNKFMKKVKEFLKNLQKREKQIEIILAEKQKKILKLQKQLNKTKFSRGIQTDYGWKQQLEIKMEENKQLKIKIGVFEAIQADSLRKEINQIDWKHDLDLKATELKTKDKKYTQLQVKYEELKKIFRQLKISKEQSQTEIASENINQKIIANKNLLKDFDAEDIQNQMYQSLNSSQTANKKKNKKLKKLFDTMSIESYRSNASTQKNLKYLNQNETNAAFPKQIAEEFQISKTDDDKAMQIVEGNAKRIGFKRTFSDGTYLFSKTNSSNEEQQSEKEDDLKAENSCQSFSSIFNQQKNNTLDQQQSVEKINKTKNKNIFKQIPKMSGFSNKKSRGQSKNLSKTIFLSKKQSYKNMETLQNSQNSQKMNEILEEAEDQIQEDETKQLFKKSKKQIQIISNNFSITKQLDIIIKNNIFNSLPQKINLKQKSLEKTHSTKKKINTHKISSLNNSQISQFLNVNKMKNKTVLKQFEKHFQEFQNNQKINSLEQKQIFSYKKKIFSAIKENIISPEEIEEFMNIINYSNNNHKSTLKKKHQSSLSNLNNQQIFREKNKFFEVNMKPSYNDFIPYTKESIYDKSTNKQNPSILNEIIKQVHANKQVHLSSENKLSSLEKKQSNKLSNTAFQIEANEDCYKECSRTKAVSAIQSEDQDEQFNQKSNKSPLFQRYSSAYQQKYEKRDSSMPHQKCQTGVFCIHIQRYFENLIKIINAKSKKVNNKKPLSLHVQKVGQKIEEKNYSPTLHFSQIKESNFNSFSNVKEEKKLKKSESFLRKSRNTNKSSLIFPQIGRFSMHELHKL